MKKKINCKHGLNEREEIQARRLKVKLLAGDKEGHDILRNFMNEWIVTGEEDEFEKFLKKKNNILFSAWKRYSAVTGLTFLAYYSQLH